MTTYRVGIGFGRYRHDQDGLGEFCLQMGRQLAARAAQLRERQGIELYFHLRKDMHGFFGNDVRYLSAHAGQKYFNETPLHFQLWHSLHQHIKYKLPLRIGSRLLTVHDLNYLYGEPADIPNWDRFTRNVVKRYDAIVTVTRHVARDVSEHLHWQGPLITIYNGTRNLCGHEQQPIAALEGKPFFFHLSRMTPSKNPDALLKLAARMKQAHFVLAGPSSEHVARVSALKAEMGLDNVSIYENISDSQKAWLYAQARAFLFPSLTEGFGLPPIEAMNFGCPVFLSDRTCLPEVGGDAAAYWSGFDAEEMEAVVNRELPRLSSAEGRRRTRDHARQFVWEKCADKYIETYTQLIHRRHLKETVAKPV